MAEFDKLEIIFQTARPLTRTEFIASLNNLEFRSPKWMYLSSKGADYPYQGDIISEMAFVTIDDDGAPAVFEPGPVMVISHGCDVEHDSMAIIAPIFSVDEVVARERTQAKKESMAATIRSNRLTNRLFLPATTNFPDSYVEFTGASSVSVRWIRKCWESAKWRERLTRQGWLLMTGKVAHHFARMEKLTDYSRD